MYDICKSAVKIINLYTFRKGVIVPLLSSQITISIGSLGAFITKGYLWPHNFILYSRSFEYSDFWNLLIYLYFGKITCNLLFKPFLSEQFSGIEYIHSVVQLLPLSFFWAFSSFQTEILYPLNNNSPFLPSYQFLIIYEFAFVLFVLLCFLDSTYKWNHVLSFSVWLISLNTIPSSSIHAAEDNKISSFFIAK